MTLNNFDSPTQDEKANKVFQVTAYLVITAGVILRAAKYLPAWSLWGDEMAVVLNLIDRSMVSLLTQPMDYEQAAPIGFLAVSKFLMYVFGRSEYVFRLVPFLSGIASLFLYHRLLAGVLNRYAALFTLAAFALGNYLIYYSVEVKQYSSDVLIAILLSLLLMKHIHGEPNTRDFINLGVAGVLALLFSHPAIFLLIAMGITLVIHHFPNRERLIKTFWVGSVWAVTFAILYFMLLRKQVTSEFLIEFWANLLSFMPMPPWRDLSWFFKALEGLYFVVGGLSGGLVIVLGLSLLGAWSFIKEKQLHWVLFIAAAVGLNMVVSGFQKFPFHGRLILYLLPLVFLMLGRGIHALTELRHHLILNMAILLLASVIMLKPAVQTANSYLISQDYVRTDIKSVFVFVQANLEDGDAMYQYYRMGRLFSYYAADYGLQDMTIYPGEKHNDRAKLYDAEINNLPRGERIWTVFTSIGETKINKDTKQDEREYILNLIRESGTILKEYYGANDGTSAHLFILE